MHGQLVGEEPPRADVERAASAMGMSTPHANRTMCEYQCTMVYCVMTVVYSAHPMTRDVITSASGGRHPTTSKATTKNAVNCSPTIPPRAPSSRHSLKCRANAPQYSTRNMQCHQ